MTVYDSYTLVSIANCGIHNRANVMVADHISELNGAEHGLIETNGYKRGFSSEFLVLYFEDRVVGSKMIANYVSDLFNVDIYELVISRNGIWAIDWINNRQEKLLGSIALKNNPSDSSDGDEAVDVVLRNGRAFDGLSIGDNVSENFQFDGKLGPAEHLVIEPFGHWVTVNNLMNFDFINIAIGGSKLSVSDLCSFLRHWRSGGSSRLTFLSLSFENDSTFAGNFDEDLEIVETNEVRKYRVTANLEIELKGGYSIQRMDGVKATINCGVRMFTMVVWHADRI
ncbi:hypothetical protein B9Z55_015883 [Caenorhabditis nigoni]|nr:hypothetical protein B9Z55_015883 [Caenorhabditis nigoni]